MKKTLLLVDGSSYLYRAYYAMFRSNLTNARGEPTGAMYGVINMLRKLLQDIDADYMACVFDAKGSTFRDDLFADYKAQRESMPEDLAQQVKPLHEIIQAMGWPLLCVPGVEADDIIGTLAHHATEHGLHTIISTGDKDLAQLVNPQVELIDTMKDERLDEAGVVEKYGVRPDQIIDYLMLMGDTSDNIPGVPKVGPKTAQKWIQQYQTLDNLIAHADEIKGVVGDNLREFIPRFELTRQLVTIRVNCDLPDGICEIDHLLPKAPDKAKLEHYYNEYGFRTWLRELTGNEEQVPRQDRSKAPLSTEPVETPQATPSTLPKIEQVEYETVTRPEQLQQWLERIEQAEWVALDTETTSLDPMQAQLVGLSLSVQMGQACYIPLAHTGMAQNQQLDKVATLEALRPWFESTKATKILQNAKYDSHVLANEGIQLQGIAHDTMLQAYVLEAHQRVNMEELMQRWLGIEGTSYESICGKGAKQIGFAELDIPTAAHYAAEDADMTLRLHHILYPQIQAQPGLLRIYDLEIQTSVVLTQVERNGVAIDSALLQKQSQALGQRLVELEQKAYELAGQPFNMNSPKQVGDILFDKLALPIKRKTASGAPSTSEDVLQELALDYPLPKLMLEYRGIAKLKSTYTDKLPKMIDAKTGRVHTRYAQAAVITGRLASSDPNLQNIPIRTPEGRQVRDAFVSSLGKVVAADYSQIELRIMAHVSGDKNLQRVFEEGGDVHRATAAEIFHIEPAAVSSEQRNAAKAINFGLIYGMGQYGLAKNLGISNAAAKSYIDRYFARYPGVAQYMETIKAQAKQQGYVETVFGRRLYFPDINVKGPRAAGAQRAAINAPMQGTAADLIKMAMVAVQHWLTKQNMRTLMVMQVHDELVFDVPEDEVPTLIEALPKLMCEVAQLEVPLIAEVGVGANWGQAH
ncbi:MAG TPA: DNA polymerase I [Paenalcaligenes hominis]|uniref:DNA polymerase I n=1 Tax=Paenalcaligenes hominis TaxID=643674 RepID=A0A9D2VGF1_9BURK|nr:DNA polymerase I [Paenalcaligenes hominis]